MELDIFLTLPTTQCSLEGGWGAIKGMWTAHWEREGTEETLSSSLCVLRHAESCRLLCGFVF